MVDLAAIVVMILGFVLFLRNPMNVGYIVGALTSLFIYLPLLIHTFLSANFIYYSMTQLIYSGEESRQLAKLYLVLLGVMWLLGAAAADNLGRAHPRRVTEIPRRLVATRSLVVLGAVFAIYVVSVGGSELSFIEMITPSRKQGVEFLESEYVRGILLASPTVLACLLVAFERRLTVWAFSSLAFALLTSLGTAQRRSVVIVLVAFLINYMMSRISRGEGRKKIDLERQIKRLTLIAMTLLSTLGPILWYARNFFTGLRSTGKASIDATMELRGFSELFFGSAATAFPATAMAVQMLETTSRSIGYSLIFMISSPIPRSMWPTKPQAPGSILIDYYNLEYSPSIFLFTELVMNFSYLAPFAALALAFVVSRFGKRLLESSEMLRSRPAKSPILCQVLFSVLVAQAMLLFKNGFALFIMQTLIWVFIATVIYHFISKRVYRAR